jgi:hypothetical protein
MLNEQERNILQNDNPTNQSVKLGEAMGDIATALARSLAVVRVVVDDTAAEGFAFTMPVAMYIADVVVQAQAAATSGKLQLRRTTTAITDAMTCAVNHAKVTSASVDDAKATTVAGETLNLISTGDDATEAGKVRAIVYIYGIPV